MKLWKIEITARPAFSYYQSHLRGTYTYTGTATTIEIAIRQAERKAKKDGLTKVQIQTVEFVGEREFGR